jgi:hypothetical protein
VTQKVQEITLFPYQGCAREVFLSKIRMNFWVVPLLLFPNTTDARGRTFPLSRFSTKKKRNGTKKLVKGKTTTETPLSHPPTPLHTSRFHCCETRRGESRSGSRLARHPHTTTRIPNSSPAPALLVVVDAATTPQPARQARRGGPADRRDGP